MTGKKAKLVAHDIMGPAVTFGVGSQVRRLFLWTSHRFHTLANDRVLLSSSEQKSCFRKRTLLTALEGASHRSWTGPSPGLPT